MRPLTAERKSVALRCADSGAVYFRPTRWQITLPFHRRSPFLRQTRVGHSACIKSEIVEPHDENVDAMTIVGEATGRIDQLLEHLAVRREVDRRANLQFLHPESQSRLHGLGRESRGNFNRCGHRRRVRGPGFIWLISCVPEGQRADWPASPSVVDRTWAPAETRNSWHATRTSSGGRAAPVVSSITRASSSARLGKPRSLRNLDHEPVAVARGHPQASVLAAIENPQIQEFLEFIGETHQDDVTFDRRHAVERRRKRNRIVWSVQDRHGSGRRIPPPACPRPNGPVPVWHRKCPAARRRNRRPEYTA